MATKYQRKTNYKPQDERQFVLKVDHHEPVDMSALADVIIMHALGRGLAEQNRFHNLVQSFPFAGSPTGREVI